MERLLVTHWRAPGDVVCLTAAVRDLALTYPGRFEIHIAGAHGPLWAGNPHVARVWGARPPGGMRRCRLSCGAALLESDRQRRHLVTAYHQDLQCQLQLPVPVWYAKGDLHLTEVEAQRPLADPYWLVVAGGKRDMPTKIWPADRFQQVVDHLRAEGMRCVQAGARLPGHRHPRLKNVVDYVGQTDLRGFLRLIYHAEGVLCPASFPMHAAAAFERPCVVIAGGREPWWLAAYTNTSVRQFGAQCAPVAVPHHFLHTIGTLDCCRVSGCWKTHVVPQGDCHPSALCVHPAMDGSAQAAPRCLLDITVEQVVAAVRQAAAESRTSSKTTSWTSNNRFGCAMRQPG